MSTIDYICGTIAISTHKGLSASTKIKLEALGIDPTFVATEAQAQILIAQAEAAPKQNGTNQQGGNASREQLVSEAKQLAKKVGVQLLENDSLENMLDKISEKITSMEDSDCKREYKAELTDIAQRAGIIVNIKQNIFNRMEMISLSNKLILGL